MTVLCDFQKIPPRRTLIQKGADANEDQDLSITQSPNDPLPKQVTYAEFQIAISMLREFS